MSRSARIVAVYVLGLAATWGWSLSQVLADSVTRENAALVIAVPLAWTFGYFSLVTPLVMLARMRSLRRLLAEISTRVRTGTPTTDEQQRELEDWATSLIAHDNGLPERLVRPLARRLVRGLLERAAAEVRAASA